MCHPFLDEALQHRSLKYRFEPGAAYQQRSLFYMSQIIETRVLGQLEYMAGSRAVIRVMLRDRAADVAIVGADVTVKVVTQDAEVLASFQGKTDMRGELAAGLDMPDYEVKNAQLIVDVATKTATDTIKKSVTIKSATRTLLTTDKPLYQPGQTIHIRALSLSRPHMKPLAKADVVFEVEDAKGNKVFKKKARTDKFGISHTDFVLADEINKGTWRVRVIAAGAKEEKTVNVERYVLPKFKVEFKTDRQYYQPGELVKGEVQSDYFFGKPVAGGKISIKCSKFDVQYVDFQSIEGKTDDNGHYKFEVRLPDNFVGQPLEQGKASVKFEVGLVDTADHKETVTRNVPITGSPIIIAAVAESGTLIPKLENRIYVVTTYADSTPAACEVVWVNSPTGKPVTIKTDEGGFGQVAFTPATASAVTMSMTARDEKGHTGQGTVKLETSQKTDDDTILLRSNKTLYKTGDKAGFTVMTTRKRGTVYLDVIKDRQTYLTRTLELINGQATDAITFGGQLSGTVQVNAYLIGRNGVIVRDRKMVVVDPANDLNIAIKPDSETYLPGEKATIQFKVTNHRNRGVASALGVMVVDEAVFALQENQPGLEKVYFYLEKEITKPRYEIHGYDLEQCIWRPMTEDRPVPLAGQARRDTAAKVLLASAKGIEGYSLNEVAVPKGQNESVYQNRMAQLLAPKYSKLQKAYNQYSRKYRKDKDKHSKKGVSFETLLENKYISPADMNDPWGTRMKVSGSWCVSCQNYHGFVLESAGIDRKFNTIDDVKVPWRPAVKRNGFALGRGMAGGMRGMGMQEEGMVMDMAMPVMAAEAKMAGPFGKPKSGIMHNADKKDGQSGGGAPIRIRQYFPETLYFNPSVITDRRGRATLTIPMADSITTWRMNCMASSARGQLGSTTAGIRVFQDFFVDIDFPVALTQNDQVHVPVAIYNYLKTDQKITLTVKPQDWFTLEGLAEKTVTLGPSEVRAVYFPVTVSKIGFKTFTVTARGTKKSDAVARVVEIVPDGKEYLVSHSGRLEGGVTHTITIPDNAIDDASKVFVKIYPGVLSQVVEGLDKMLRMPFGCFEQTSSVTYPNILVLDYMKTTGKITPELQMKAEGFINAGYQRLVSFEVDGGGFEWFGKAPAHRILTAYGLMEFYDMSKVHEVDPAIITRTQQWLARCQEKDGSWKPSAGGIREGAINKFVDDVLRNTAYITWALAYTGYTGPEVQKGVRFMRNHLDDMKDVYTRALVANAMAQIDPKDKTTLDTLRALHDMRTEEGDVAYWKAQSKTPTHGAGKSADIEVTALAVQAFIRCGRELGTVTKAVTYLTKNKDAYGTWQSTQATIQALRAMLMAEAGATANTNAEIELSMSGEMVRQIKVDESNSDLLQLVDLKDMTRKGKNSVALKFKGEGSLLYQVVGRYYLPYQRTVHHTEEPMTIDLKYDRTELATNDIITATATVTNNRPATAKMIIVDLGLPPGFTLLPDRLNKLVKDGAIEKYSTTGRQIIIYLRELKHSKPVTISYQLLAKYPLKAKTPKSTVYEYYDPDVKNVAKPVEITVNKAD